MNAMPCCFITAAEQPGTLAEVCPQQFMAPVAPHRAAHLEGTRVDSTRLRAGVELWRQRCDLVLVEGAGGLLSPISDDDLVADVAQDLGYPLLIVAPNVLGTINQTLQTVAVAHARGLAVAGIVVNHPQPIADESSRWNIEDIQQRCDVAIVAALNHSAETFDREVNWQALAR